MNIDFSEIAKREFLRGYIWNLDPNGKPDIRTVPIEELEKIYEKYIECNSTVVNDFKREI